MQKRDRAKRLSRFLHQRPCTGPLGNTSMNYLEPPIRSISALALIFTLVLLTNGQTATPTPRISEDTSVVKVNSRLIVVPVSVVDANGEPVLGLKAEDFKVTEENRIQMLENVGDALSTPLEIALLFDVSCKHGCDVQISAGNRSKVFERSNAAR